MQLLKRNIDLVLILAIAFLLRFSVSIIHSYTNDELSAINRLRYTSFSELIEKGVKQGDMHPAGVQVFEKAWSSLFGTSELALRLPFVFFGTASVFLIFLIGKRWFNHQTGIIAAAILCVLNFTIIQSELARPYSPGLLIVLTTSWFWHRVLFDEVKKYRHAVFLGLSFAAGMYTHYFLFLSLMLIGFTGLFFLKKENIKHYSLAVALAILLFIPHIQVTLHHLSVGGLGWLGKPDTDFIFQFIFYAFNESWIVLTLIFGLILVALFFFRQTEKFQSRNYWLLAGWFFGIYGVGHVLSIVSTPVLKFPVMLFAFPFLILMIAYLTSAITWKKSVAALIIGVGIYSSIYKSGLYDMRHLGYRSTAKHLVDWNKEYGDENIYTVYNLSNPDYMNFYARQFGDSVHFEWDVIEFSDDKNIRRDLEKRSEKFCVVGYSERLTLPQVFETTREFYPKIVEYSTYENSGVFLLSKEDIGIFDYEPESELFSAMDLYESSNASWIINPALISNDSATGKKAYHLDNINLYGPDFVFKAGDARKKAIHFYLKIKVNASCPVDGQLTTTITATRNGEPLYHQDEIFWMGHDLEEMLLTTQDSSGVGSAYFAVDIPPFIRDEDELKISLWNRNGLPITVTSFEIWIVENIWN